MLEAGDGPSGLETARARAPGRDPPRRDDAGARRLAGRRAAARRRGDERDPDRLPDRARGAARPRPRIDLGGIDYVTKPFNPVELAPLVRALSAGREGERDELRSEKLAELRALFAR